MPESLQGGAAPAGDDVLILAVDDMPDNLAVLEALLARPGVRLLTATTADQALEYLLVHDVALALLDVRMPGISGFDLAELMRGAERSRRVPIIFITAGTRDEGRIFRGYEAGAVDFLFKPIDPHLLRSKVGVFVELFVQRRLLAAQVDEHRQLVRTAELLIGVLGHDLRSPLGAIVNAGEALTLAYPGDERLAGIAAIIGSSSKRMTRLIAQLLDFATARLGGLPVRPVPTDLQRVCEAALQECAPETSLVHLRTEGDLRGTWDADRLFQVLTNLVSNALQHGERGGVVAVAVCGSGPDEVTIEVTNSGEIRADLLSQLFQPFMPSTSGTGLGLYIVDQIARAQGGTVSVASSQGRITFRVTLPRHVSVADGVAAR